MQRLALVLVLVLAAAAPAAVDAKAPDPKAMVLQLTDLPGGFGRDVGRYVSNAQLAETSTRKDFRKLGRVDGYYTEYTTIGLGGLTAVSSFASIYRLGRGAHLSLVESLAQAESQGGLVVAPHKGLTSLGTDARLFLQRATQNGAKLDFYTVVWRDGHVFAEVMGAGRAGTIDPAQVVALARKQATRIVRITG